MLHTVKKLHSQTGSKLAGSTHEGEGVGTTRGAEYAMYGRVIEAALGVPPKAPTRIITDSLSNQRVASGNGTSTNSRHFLLRYELLLEHVQAGHLDIVYTTDAENPADYLSKFVPPAKQLTSARYSAGRATAAAGFVAAAG